MVDIRSWPCEGDADQPNTILVTVRLTINMAVSAQLAALVPLSILFAALIWRFIQDRIERKGYPLPPGPTPLPFLGSALSVNIREPFRTYTEWRTKYGECGDAK